MTKLSRVPCTGRRQADRISRAMTRYSMYGRRRIALSRPTRYKSPTFGNWPNLFPRPRAVSQGLRKGHCAREGKRPIDTNTSGERLEDGSIIASRQDYELVYEPSECLHRERPSREWTGALKLLEVLQKNPDMTRAGCTRGPIHFGQDLEEDIAQATKAGLLETSGRGRGRL